TPLAIIKAKIDNIINEYNINDKQFEQISSIQKNIQRLKHLNQQITLITKIDNNHFIRVEKVNDTKQLEEKIENYKEMEIDYISLNSKTDLIVSMDIYLADILINNLISNAIKHSGDKKNISIISENKTLVISNYGQKALKHPEKLFLRF